MHLTYVAQEHLIDMRALRVVIGEVAGGVAVACPLLISRVLIGQHVSNLYGLAGHEVGLKPSCACVAPPLPNPLLTARASAVFIC